MINLSSHDPASMKPFSLLHVITFTILTFIAGLILGYVFGYDHGWEKQIPASPVTNFEECAAAGNPVMESHPRRCRAQNGITYTEILPTTPTSSMPTAPTSSPTIPPASDQSCIRAGCGNELCVDATHSDGIVSFCIYRPEYACYKNARCERQTNGTCGWTQSEELQACLANPPSVE